MGKSTTLFAGLDVHKDSIDISFCDAGPRGGTAILYGQVSCVGVTHLHSDADCGSGRGSGEGGINRGGRGA